MQIYSFTYNVSTSNAGLYLYSYPIIYSATADIKIGEFPFSRAGF